MKVRPHLGFIIFGEDKMQFRTTWIGGMCGDKDEGAVAEKEKQEQDVGISVFSIRQKKPCLMLMFQI
jgi:hypothetical protein